MDGSFLTCVRKRSACIANAGSVTEIYWITSSMLQSAATPFGNCGLTDGRILSLTSDFVVGFFQSVKFEWNENMRLTCIILYLNLPTPLDDVNDGGTVFVLWPSVWWLLKAGILGVGDSIADCGTVVSGGGVGNCCSNGVGDRRSRFTAHGGGESDTSDFIDRFKSLWAQVSHCSGPGSRVIRFGHALHDEHNVFRKLLIPLSCKWLGIFT